MSASPFVVRRAAVASPHWLATEAGVRILERGGSAVDAMVAVNAALGVVYPHMTGPGGDAFWLIHDARTGSTHALNASGRSAAAATIERYSAGGAKLIEPRGPRAALTVPGAVDGWVQAHTRFGRLSLAECLAPAIGLARDGYPVSEGQARYTARYHELLATHPASAAIFLKPGGAPYAAGETFRHPRLANTLEEIAGEGRASFYEGTLAEAVCAALAREGGVLSADDFAAHTSEWEDPLRVEYRAYTALNLPPNSQGFAALQILGILDCYDLGDLAEQPAYYVDMVVRATRLAFEDRDRYLTDPTVEHIPLAELLDPGYLRDRARLMTVGPPRPTLAPHQPGGGDTTFSCCVDADGNAVGVIQSLYFEWGSGVVAGETGLLLQNRGAFFSLDPAHPNRLAPRKRTFHTLSAALLLDADGRPRLVYGAMGGEGQPQTQAMIATRVVDFGQDLQSAIDAPRWLYGRTWGEEYRGLRLEARFGEEAAAALRERGHERVELVPDWDDLMGHAQAIQVFPDHLEAVADPRGDGAAMGF